MRVTAGRVLTGLAVLALAGGLAFAGMRLFGPVQIEVATPTRGPAVEAVYATGTVEPTVMMPIAPRVAGRLVKLSVDEGARVRKGQLLAQLEAQDMRDTVSELDARRAQAQRDYDRAAKLLREGWGTRVARDKARADLRALDAQIGRARTQMGYMFLRAPADGEILKRDGEVGEFLAVGQPLFYLSCCAPLRITTEVDEEDIPRVHPGQQVLIYSDAFPEQVFRGTVSQITPKGDPVARSYRVRVGFPADSALRIGMTAETNILIAERANALLVPAVAVDRNKVWVVRDGRLAPQAVTIGVSARGRVEILSGLTDDAVMAVNPAATFKAGQRVRTRPWTPPAED